MTFECLDLLSQSPTLLAAGAEYAAEPASNLPGRGEMFWLLSWSITLGLATICLGIILTLVALVKGPQLADRVLAADLLALHVVALVLLLTIYMGKLVFFDAALVVAIIGFVSTVGFSQYICAKADRPDDPLLFDEGETTAAKPATDPGAPS